ncbi:MAG TPA: type III-B CRISPR module RAMP protein Cmr6 [Ktedonobacteraceae bacterium]|jgi:CRISPR-associated protein Cmr6
MRYSRRATLQDLVLHAANREQQNHEVVLASGQGVHPGLWLDKYSSSLERFKASDQSPQQQLVRDVSSLGVPEIYRLWYEHWQQSLQDAGARSSVFSVRGRMVVGLGNEAVLETSLSLHRTYGVPCIPGSALKGLAANYARLMAGPDWQQGNPAYRVVFGDTKSAGYVTFFDALYIPAERQEGTSEEHTVRPDCPVHPDVITVHHPQYYQGKKDAPPADWDSPNPISFLSTSGRYLVALAAPDLDNADAWLEKVFDLLEEALLISGVGARTSSGYGRMRRERGSDVPETVTVEDAEDLQTASKLLEKIWQIPDKQVTAQMRSIGEKGLQLRSLRARTTLVRAIEARFRQVGKESELKKLRWYRQMAKDGEEETS